MLHVFGHLLFGLVVGILGAWLGGFLGRALRIYPAGHPAGFFMALIGASIILLLYGYFTGPKPLQSRYGASVLVARTALPRVAVSRL